MKYVMQKYLCYHTPEVMLNCSSQTTRVGFNENTNTQEPYKIIDQKWNIRNELFHRGIVTKSVLNSLWDIFSQWNNFESPKIVSIRECLLYILNMHNLTLNYDKLPFDKLLPLYFHMHSNNMITYPNKKNMIKINK